MSSKLIGELLIFLGKALKFQIELFVLLVDSLSFLFNLIKFSLESGVLVSDLLSSFADVLCVKIDSSKRLLLLLEVCFLLFDLLGHLRILIVQGFNLLFQVVIFRSDGLVISAEFGVLLLQLFVKIFDFVELILDLLKLVLFQR